MTLFEINEAIAKAIENAIDPETGEITDFSELEALAISRDEKIKNTALYILNIRAEAEEVAKQEQKFKERKQKLLNKAKRIEDKLAFDLNGDKFESIEVNISYRKSKGVEITNDVDFELFAIDHTEYIKPFKIEADKNAIKEALAKGIAIPGCEIVEKQNMQIK
jgi:hypothetical protein